MGWKNFYLLMVTFSFNQDWGKWKTEKRRVEGCFKRQNLGIRWRRQTLLLQSSPKVLVAEISCAYLTLWTQIVPPCLFCLSCFPFITETFLMVLKRLLCYHIFRYSSADQALLGHHEWHSGEVKMWSGNDDCLILSSALPWICAFLG